jgi:hypothetical protein
MTIYICFGRVLNLVFSNEFKPTVLFIDVAILCTEVGAFFGAGVRLFGNWLFLAKLTPAMPDLVEFCWEKEGGISYCHIFG